MFPELWKFFFSPLFLVLEASDILVSTVISSLPLLSYTCTYNNISLLTTVFILNVVLEFEFSSFHCNSISLFPLHTVSIVLLRFPFVIGPTVQVLLSQTPTCQLTTTCLWVKTFTNFMSTVNLRNCVIDLYLLSVTFMTKLSATKWY